MPAHGLKWGLGGIQAGRVTAIALSTHATTAPATLAHAPSTMSATLFSASTHPSTHASSATATTGPAAHARTPAGAGLARKGGRFASHAGMTGNGRLAGTIELSGLELFDDISHGARTTGDYSDAGGGERLVGVRAAIARENELHVLRRHELGRLNTGPTA